MWNIRCLIDKSFVPANQCIILYIVGFQMSIVFYGLVDETPNVPDVTEPTAVSHDCQEITVSWKIPKSGTQNKYQFDKMVNEKASWTTGSTSKSKAIWYIPNISRWCIGLLTDRDAKHDDCFIFLRDETDLLYPKKNVWQYWIEQQNGVSSGHDANGVSVKCTTRNNQRGINFIKFCWY